MDLLRSRILSELPLIAHGTFRNRFLPDSHVMDAEHASEIFASMGYDPNRAVLMQQTHSDHIATVSSSDAGRGILKDIPSFSDTDGLITDAENVFLFVRSADCAPVLLYDANTKVIAAIHAGWRGTGQQIITKAIARMKNEYGSRPEDMYAYIGPCICVESYEVSQAPDNRIQQFEKLFGSEAVKREGDKVYIDLKEANRIQLQQSGVQHIEVSEHCTAKDPEKLPSHYRDGQMRTEQMLTFIGMTQK